MWRRSTPFLAFLLACSGAVAAAEPVTVAVASNFTSIARDLADRFQRDSGVAVRISSASTGKLYAQIVNGAPFDVLLAADAERPRLLPERSLAVAGYTYAIGALVAWSRQPELPSGDCLDILQQDDPGKIAIANPEIAPYGAAARDALVALGLWERHRERIVMGENIGQAMSFTASGNAAVGFVAAAQLDVAGLPGATCEWQVPIDLHEPIEQQAALLARAADNPDARAFFEFLRGAEARRVIADGGYALPAVQ